MLIMTSIRSAKTSKSASGAVNYILSDKDYTGAVRSVKPKVIFGDPELVKMYDQDPRINKRNKATSGVIAFRENEKITDEKMPEFIARFKELCLPHELQEKIDMLVVEHGDKGNQELHFVIPHLTIDGYRFNPFSVIGNDKGAHQIKAAQAIQRILNHELGFDQVEAGVGARNGLNRDEFKFKNNSPNKDDKLFRIVKNKEQLTKNILKFVSQRGIQDRSTLIDAIQEQGFEITRQGQDYISIKKQGMKKAYRLKGGIFNKDNTDGYAILNNEKPTQVNYGEAERQRDMELVNDFHALVYDRYFNKQNNQKKLKQIFNEAEKSIKGGNRININKQQTKHTQSQEKQPQQHKTNQDGISNRSVNKPTGKTVKTKLNIGITTTQGLNNKIIALTIITGIASSGIDVESAEASVNQAISAIKQAENQFGPNSRQAKEARAQLQAAQKNLIATQAAKAREQDEQRKKYKPSFS